ncbi:MAG: two pore domain potassium channel family protein [Actinotalea sp.]|nr:two pore domain potassium channel family protein [Actinotalea sp.]
MAGRAAGGRPGTGCRRPGHPQRRHPHLVILTWGTLLVLGWALVYLPRLPEGFSYGDLDPTGRAGFIDAVYLSTVVLATLGFGDIVPTDPWLRLLTPVQALLGFALLTASVSWVLQVQPALGRRRALARHLTMLRAAQVETGTTLLSPSEVTSLASRLARVHVDLRQASPTFYFVEQEQPEALPRVLPFVRDVARRAARADDPALRASGTALDRTVTDLARLLRGRFLAMPEDAGTDAVLARFATVHGHEPEVAAPEED